MDDHFEQEEGESRRGRAGSLTPHPRPRLPWAGVLLLSFAGLTLVPRFAEEAASAPASIRFELRSHAWASFPNADRSVSDTTIVMAVPGEPIELERTSARDWYFEGPPMVCGSVAGEGRVWVRFTSEIVPAVLGPFDPDPGSTDSILVSTSWRSFVTQVTDGGVEFGLRVVPERQARGSAPESTLIVTPRRRQPRGGSELEKVVAEAPVIGVFRLLEVSPQRDSLLVGGRRVPITDLRFQVVDLWRGARLIPASVITVPVPYGIRTDSSWVRIQGSTPMMRGQPVVLFLRSSSIVPSQRGWTFDALRCGYGLFDESETLVFTGFARGVPIARFRRDVEAAAWPYGHPYRGRVRGCVFLGDTGQPAAGWRVSVGAEGHATTTDTSGSFELAGMPIGLNPLRMEGPCGAASALIEISDEFTDSLEVRVPCAALPSRAR